MDNPAWMVVVLDTTVLFQALRGQGASYYILSLVRQSQMDSFLAFISYIAKPIVIHFTYKPNLREIMAGVPKKRKLPHWDRI
ncbi:MAG: hypothetical protein LDLANPLL_01553 [Turneriella sp.]|nr:hypothetical protein [Turneriella sp.]